MLELLLFSKHSFVSHRENTLEECIKVKFSAPYPIKIKKQIVPENRRK
jgi:hypothetical protein